jgi:hypothetical protein
LEEFVKHLKWLLVARDEFDLFMKAEPASLTDIQRAVPVLLPDSYRLRQPRSQSNVLDWRCPSQQFQSAAD